MKKRILSMLLCIVMVCSLLPTGAMAAGEMTDIGDTYADELADLTALAAAYPAALEVKESAGSITVKLLKDVTGRIELAIEGAHIIFDANGKGFSGGTKNQALTLVHYKGVTAELIGNGQYTTGAHNTIFVGSGNTLIIKSATIEGMLRNNGGTVKTAVQDGYDAYIAKKNDADVYSEAYNTAEKTLTSYPGATDTLVVQPTNFATYTVSFDGNGASGSMSQVTGVFGEYTLPENNWPSNGFYAPYKKYFAGWLVDGILKAPGEKITVISDITIKAVWEDSHYNLTLGGVEVTYLNASDVFGDGTVSYDPATKTLTLNNANITGTAVGGPVRSAVWASSGPEDLTIALVGNNTISSIIPSGEAQTSHNYAMYVNSVHFTGSGSLYASAGEAETFSYGINADNITVGSECTVIFASGTATTSFGGHMYAVSCDQLTADGSVILASSSNAGMPLTTYSELGMYGSKYVKIQPACDVTVSFDANGGSGAMADETVACAGEYTLPANGFTAPAGQQFKGWSVNGSEKAAGDKVIVVENTTVTAVWEDIPHTCNIQPVEKVWPDCESGGKEAYYQCEGCGKFFEDDLGVTEIADIATWGNLPQKGHCYTQQIKDAAHLKAEAAKCDEYDTYWYDCADCDANAKDDPAASNQFYTSADAGEHSFTEQLADDAHLVAGTGANCQDAKEYYYDCAYCAKIGTTSWVSTTMGGHSFNTNEWGYKDQAAGHAHQCGFCTEHDTVQPHTPGAAATEDDDQICTECLIVLVPKTGHICKNHLTQVPAQGASCPNDGNIEYYECSCGKYYADANVSVEITDKDSVVIQATHDHSTEWDANQNNHWNECACGDKANTAAHTDENADGKCDVCEYNVGVSAPPSNPQTGDGTMLWFVLLLASGFAVAAISLLNKKRFCAR